MNDDFAVQLLKKQDMTVNQRIDAMLIRYGLIKPPPDLRVVCACGWEIVAPEPDALAARKQHPCFQKNASRKPVMRPHRTPDEKKAEARRNGNASSRIRTANMGRAPVHTKSSAIAAIQKLAERLGHVPSYLEAKGQPGVPGHAALDRLYEGNSYSKLLEDAGFCSRKVGRPKKVAA